MGAHLGLVGGPTRMVAEFGTGRLGSVTFTADGTSTPSGWTWDSGTGSYMYTGAAMALEYRSVTVAANVRLRLAGCPLLVQDTLTLASGAHLAASGSMASAATGGATTTRVASAWLGGGTAGASGTAAPASGTASTAIASGAMGGRGGSGGTVSSTPTARAGGAAGTIGAWTPVDGPVAQALTFHPFQGRSSLTPTGGTGGGSGGSGGAGTSPGGGGGAGVLVVCARRIVYSEASAMGGSPVRWMGHLRADGGAGSSTPTGIVSNTIMGGGGGGGGGGVVLLVDTLAPTDGSALYAVSYGGDGGGAYAGVASTYAVSGGAGGTGGQVWIMYAQGPVPVADVTGGVGGSGGSGIGGGAAGADGSAGASYVLAVGR